MCTKKTLFEAGNCPNARLETRKRGESLNFRQITFATACVREYAARMNVSIHSATLMLRQDPSAFSLIYKAAKLTPEVSAKLTAEKVLAR